MASRLVFGGERTRAHKEARTPSRVLKERRVTGTPFSAIRSNIRNRHAFYNKTLVEEAQSDDDDNDDGPTLSLRSATSSPSIRVSFRYSLSRFRIGNSRFGT